MAISLFSLVSVLGLVFTARWILRYFRTRAFMARSGCLSPPTIDGGYLGSCAARETTRALREGNYLALSRKRYATAGNTYQGSLLGQQFLATIDHENLKAIFVRTEDFTKGGRKTDWWPMLQGGILVSDGMEWHKSRALLRPTFAKTQLKDFDKLETHVMKLISQVPRNGGTVELQSLFQTLTLHAGLDYLLGQNDESELAQKEQERFSENLHNAVFEAGRRAKIGVFRLLDPIIRPIKFARYLVACRELHQYVDRIIHVRLSATEKQKNTKSRDTQSSEDHERKEYVFLDHLAEATQDRKQLRWELASTISGARDTTAGLMAHIFWELARRPDIWLRLKQETEALGNEKPEPEMLETMVYLKAIIYESLRMYPNIGITFRWAAHDTTLPVGGGPDGRSPCFVPAGRRIITSFNALHRRRDVWGDDADEFRPERWIITEDDEKKGATRSRIRTMPAWTYLPFGAGARICPGRHFALVEAQYTIVRMMQTFQRVEKRDDRPYAEEAGIPITLKHGTLVGLFRE